MCGTGVSPVNYTWDAENRLTRVQSGDPNSPASGDKKVEFVYDYLGRRVEKKVSTHNGTSWSVSACRRFVWSDWLLVLELDASDPNDVTILRKYTWGLDLGGHNQSPERERGVSIDSAGGIGGLLATEDVADTKDYYYFYDANGNVGQVLDASDGTIAAKYEYDAYGNNLLDPNDPNESGSYAADNPLRFSSKYWDDETGLGYWGYRFYSPTLGRWLNRDPLSGAETVEGANLYAYAHNAPRSFFDPHGKWNIGIGLCASGTLMISGGPSTGLPGLSLSWSRVLIISSKSPRCRVCDTGSVTVIPGLGVNISVGAGPVVTGGLGEQPSEGLSISVGVGAGGNISTLTGAEAVFEIDVSNGQATFIAPRLTAGMTGYVGFRVSVTCTGCSRFPGGPTGRRLRAQKLGMCLNRIQQAFSTAIQRINGMVVPANQEIRQTFYVGEISIDALPEGVHVGED